MFSARACKRYVRAAFAGVCGATMLAPNDAGAQVATYRRDPGDTARFHEVTRITGQTRGRAGDVEFTIAQSASISIAFVTADSARAWYDGLSFEVIGPSGKQPIPMESVLRVPYALHIDSRGRIQALSSPTYPTQLRDWASYMAEFDDFLPRLPDGPMAIGTQWGDTTYRHEDEGGRKLTIRRIGRYRAEGDTVVNGRKGRVISIALDIRLESSMPLQQSTFTADLVLTGTEEGTAVFSIELGRLLGRDRSGTVEGSTTYRGTATPVSVKQSYQYRGSIVPVVTSPPKR